MVSIKQLWLRGYHVTQDAGLENQLKKLEQHLEKPFFFDRFNKGIDSKGNSFEAKNAERLEYIQSLSGEEATLFNLLLSDPNPKIREVAAKKLILELKEIKRIIGNGVPMVIQYENGKGIIVDQEDYFVLKGFLDNPRVDLMPIDIKISLKEITNRLKRNNIEL
jgi:hypothetical protein